MVGRTFLDIMNDLDDWNEELAQRSTTSSNQKTKQQNNTEDAKFEENETGQLEFVFPKNNTSEEEAE